MVKISDKSVRYCFTAPISDVQLAEWIEIQHNLSMSIRLVIKDYIAKHGMADATCLPMMTDDDSATKYEQEFRKFMRETNNVPEEPSVPEIKNEAKAEPVPAAPVPQASAMMDDMLADLMK